MTRCRRAMMPEATDGSPSAVTAAIARSPATTGIAEEASSVVAPTGSRGAVKWDVIRKTYPYRRNANVAG